MAPQQRRHPHMPGSTRRRLRQLLGDTWRQRGLRGTDEGRDFRCSERHMAHRAGSRIPVRRRIRRYPASVSGTPTKVFIARLAGIAVFDPNGDQVGRVRDVVVLLRLAGQPPRVTGLVVEVQPRRRIFVPISRVTALDAGQVIIHGTVSLRRFEQRPGETLVLAEMLDRRVTEREDDETVTVVDVAMEQIRTRDWLVTRVAVRTSGGGLRRRRGEIRTLNWDQVIGFGRDEEEQGAANLLAAFD